MTDSPLRAKGRAMRRNLMGAAYADKLDRQLYTDPIMEKFAALTQETVFGSLWTRPELDLKTRTLICVVSDTATGRTPELKLHIRFARNHGWAEDELVEAILHLLGYVGAPLVREALLVAKETFAEMRAEIRSRHNSELAALRHFGREMLSWSYSQFDKKDVRPPSRAAGSGPEMAEAGGLAAYSPPIVGIYRTQVNRQMIKFFARRRLPKNRSSNRPRSNCHQPENGQDGEP